MRKPGGRVRLSFIRPMEPELVEQPPKGGEWGHEVKFDGYRTQVIKELKASASSPRTASTGLQSTGRSATRQRP